MIKRRKYTKYVMAIALITMLTFMWGCKADIAPPPVDVTGITVTGAEDAITVDNGATLQMSAAVLPTDANDLSVIWSIEAGTGTATISESGLLTATSAGTVTVKATANDDSAFVGELEVTVNTAVTSPVDVISIIITGAEDAITLENGSTLQMNAAVLPPDATDKSLTWSVEAGTGTATISESGLLTATSTGTVTVKATANDESAFVGELEVTVTAVVTTPVDVASITVTGAEEAIVVPYTSTLQMSAAVLPVDATDKSLTWSVVAGTGTATISEAGLLTGTAVGTVTVNATANDGSGIVGTLGITVTEKVISEKAILGVTAPVTGESPVTAITNTQEYTSSSVTWTKADLTVLAPEGTYEVDTVYIATITLTPVTGYTLSGVTENLFTVEGATATNASDLGVVTATFPATTIIPLTRVDLGTADNFVILAKTGITTTGATEITGDMGISPAALSTVTGFGETLSTDGTYATSSFVLGGGKIYASDFETPTPEMLIAAIVDMETAYNDIVALANPRPEAIVGGVTLTPGLYKSVPAVSLALNLTLDGEGDEGAVWVFQITGALDVAANVEIILTNGAKAENVFWQVTGAISLLANSKMQGIVLGEGVIALTDGATITGKLLGQSNVTLIANTVIDPVFVPIL